MRQEVIKQVLCSFIPAALLIFVLISCRSTPQSEPVGRDTMPQKTAETVKLTFYSCDDKEKNEVLSALESIRDLPRAEIAIDEDMYRRHARFKAIFGFNFDGRKLHHWLTSRVNTFICREAWATAVYTGEQTVALSPGFFRSLPLEQMYLLVHEARHYDIKGHIDCPGDYLFLSTGDYGTELAGQPACDNRPDGAYGVQAAFLFELYARRLADARLTASLYNGSISRIIKSE